MATTTTHTGKKIRIADVGPVHSLEIPLPEQGGIVVLRGRNGRGKSKALEAVDSLMSGRGKIEARDGTLRGEVEGFGAKITIARATRRTGQAEVLTLEGRFNVADLVQPPIKDPGAADAQRIKALVQLSGVKCCPAPFAELVGGIDALKETVPPDDFETDDVVVLAGRVKRRLEAEARKSEGQAEHAATRAKMLQAATEGVDLTAEANSITLQMALEEAIEQASAVKQQAKTVQDALETAQTARQELDKAEGQYTGLTVEAARVEEADAKQALDESNEEVESSRATLRKVEAIAETRRVQYSTAISIRKNAEAHEAAMAAWRKQVEQAEQIIPVDPEQITQAEQAVQQARQAVEQGAIVRRAKQSLDQAAAVLHEQADHEKRALQLREAAKGTDDVLSQAISQSCSRLRVEAGRLVTDTVRGVTYYGDLSHGERWSIALDVAIDALPAGGVLTLPQEAWESLDPIARSAIAEHVERRNTVLLTAQCSEEEQITATLF